MKKTNEWEFYEERKDWNFERFEIETEDYLNWDFYELLKKHATKESKILDLGTGGGEKLLKNFPDCDEILGTDYSEAMIKTANENLKKSKRKNITFRLMDNLHMDVLKNYYDIVVARNTVTDPKQIYEAIKDNGYLLIKGVDQYDCYSLKLAFGVEKKEKKAISIIDYENCLKAGFKKVDLVSIAQIEYFKNKKILINRFYIYYNKHCKYPIRK